MRPETLRQPDLHMVGEMEEIMPSAIRRNMLSGKPCDLPGNLQEGAWNGQSQEGGSMGKDEQEMK